jgi:outer membrane protein assembly factor BamB
MLKRIAFFIALVSIVSIVGAEYPDIDLSWSINVPEKIESLYIEDLDNDGFLEIVVVAKGRVYSSDKIYVLGKNGLIRWNYELEDIQSVDVSDIDNDIYKEILVSCGRVREGIGRGVIYIIDKDGKLSLQFPPSRLKSSVLLKKIEAIDLDGDGYKEVVGNTHDEICVLRDSYDDFSTVVVVDEKIDRTFVEDLNWDGYMDVITIGAYDVYDVSLEGMIRWHYELRENINTAIIANHYVWGNNEVILTTTNNTIYVLDDSGNLRVKDNITEGIIGVIPADFDADGFDELVFGTLDGVYFLDMDTNVSYGCTTNSSIKTLSATFLGQGSELEIFASDGTKIYEISKDGSLMKTFKLRQNINEIYLEDLDNDGVKELVTSSDSFVSVYEFELEGGDRDKLAKEHYDRAYFYLNVGYLENATFHAEKAFSIYSELNDSAGIAKCRTLLQRIGEKINEQAPTTLITVTSTSTTMETGHVPVEDYGTLMVAVIVILALIIAVLILRIIAVVLKERKSEEKTESEVEETADYGEILNLPLKYAKERITGIENPDYDKIIEIEKANKNRKSLIEWLKNR